MWYLCGEMSEENYNQSLRLNNDRFFFVVLL